VVIPANYPTDSEEESEDSGDESDVSSRSSPPSQGKRKCKTKKKAKKGVNIVHRLILVIRMYANIVLKSEDLGDESDASSRSLPPSQGKRKRKTKKKAKKRVKIVCISS